MKRISLQWRITLMTVLLIGVTCVAMNYLLGCSGRHYMDSIGTSIQFSGDAAGGEPAFFDPALAEDDQELTIIIHGAQASFITTNWYITEAAYISSPVFCSLAIAIARSLSAV